MIVQYFRNLWHDGIRGWNRFWFTPKDDATLSVIRICIGLLLTWSHLVWLCHSSSFFGPSAWLNQETVVALQTSSAAFSPLWLIDNHRWAIAVLHVVATLSAVLLTIGCWSRVAAIATCFFTISFSQRNPAALYGFDQVLGMATLYLSISPGHHWLSVDAWHMTRRSNLTAANQRYLSRTTTARIATRLIQIHLCVLYFFAGVSKLKGAAWWTGVAFWGAIANHEYQTIDLTWLVDWPIVINALTLGTIAWEVSYPFLIWNRHLRPLVLMVAACVHLGIALCFGMMTFGLGMLVVNLAFVSPQIIREIAAGPIRAMFTLPSLPPGPEQEQRA